MPSYLSPGVYMEEVSSGMKPVEGVGTAVAAFVGFAEKGPLNEPVLVTNWTQFTDTFGEFVEDSYLAHAVYGYFSNGGGVAYVVRVGSGIAGGQADQPALGTARLQLPAPGEEKSISLRALDPGPAGAAITVEVHDASEPTDENFKLVVKRGEQEEVFDNVTVRRGPNSVASALRQNSKLVTLDDVRGAALAVPQKGTVMQLTSPDTPGQGATEPVRPEDYVGNSADRTGFAGLEAVEDVTMLAIPDLMAAYQNGALDDEGLKAVQLAMIAHCELMGDRVALLDAPPGLTAQAVKDWRLNKAGYDSKFATLYWPWTKVMDPASGRAIHIPPSGYVAGVWARTDDTRGVHKAPANEVLRGVLSLERDITRGEHDQLNPIGVNCIRAFPGQGIRVWGARTLSSDPEWRYLNVRRLFNYVEKSILNGTNWVVFEPNDQLLWQSVRRNIIMFLRGVWRSGALFGRTPEEAFYVKCDDENNPPESRDAGVLTVDIGIAPVKPAEFVVFRLSQFSQGAELSE
ncbi:MAG: phage tail sheath subtilisin-like domain-containing protein [Actinomycetota bacterium]|nr:phage tail sheath subtilisin-like domain-containing protein [Actinomycetota bacterium]